MKSSENSIRSICVYCGSSEGDDPAYVEQATALGVAMAAAGIRLVYGGGDIGLMGAVARGVLSGGGSVLGIIPEFLLKHERLENRASVPGAEMVVVPDMHTRKKRMFDEADAFIALPGGTGTLEELVEIMTWSQLRRHTRPMALLNTKDFWSPLIALVDHMIEAGFLHNPELVELKVAATADDVLPIFGITPAAPA